MRLLVVGDEKTHAYEVVEITCAGYDDDITCLKDDDKNCQAPVEGLFYIDSEQQWWYVPNLSIEECNRICKELAEKGFADLTCYAAYNSEEDIKNY